MKSKKILKTALCILVIMLIGGIGLYYYRTMHYITATLTKEVGREITGNLNRPDCGWYQLYGYYLRPDTSLTSNELYIREKDDDNYTYRLSLVEFNLAEYAKQELDESALNNIRQVFELFSDTKSSIIVRFLYDWDGLGMEKEPDDIHIIEQHMQKVGALLNEYDHIIYTTQGIFVGSWAEMHHSKYLSAEDMTRLLLCYASSTSPSIFLAVRTPNHYRTVFKELEEYPERYKDYGITVEELKARLGLYNDGMLGSTSDTGTYQNTPDISAQDEKELRFSELAFQQELCMNVPNGGEVVNNNPYNDGENAIPDLKTMHISYLNQMYDSAVIDKWKKSTYRQTNSIYDGMTVYDYITDHLGARFVLTDCSLSYTPYQKGPATGSITVENAGFSNLYHTKRFMLSLINNKTGETVTLLDSESETDNINPCHWNSQESITLPFSFVPFDLEDGDYTLTASLTEPDSREIISFANDGYTDELQGYKLGTVTIKR